MVLGSNRSRDHVGLCGVSVYVGVTMQNLLLTMLFAALWITSPEPVLFPIMVGAIWFSLMSRLFFIRALPHRKGRKYA
jgi:hypothetical protein